MDCHSVTEWCNPLFDMVLGIFEWHCSAGEECYCSAGEEHYFEIFSIRSVSFRINFLSIVSGPLVYLNMF